ncbi:MAG: hypothetical protein ACOYOL_03290 [Chthoniobacterales bacterium]
MTGRVIFWISGWSIPASSLREAATRAFPTWHHEAIDAGPNALACAHASEATMLGGFSFGANLLLSTNDPRPRLLLAPFVDLKSESRLGGAMASTRIRQQLRQLKRDPAGAVADFRRLVGMEHLPIDPRPETTALAWGLEQMLGAATVPPLLPPGSMAVVGRQDPLLDVDTLQTILPFLQVVDAAHDLERLLAAAAALEQDAA